MEKDSAVERREDPAGIPVEKNILKSCEGVYRFREDRAAGIWRGISTIAAIALTKIILSDGTALEEDTNLGTYTSGWDERIAVCGPAAFSPRFYKAPFI